MSEELYIFLTTILPIGFCLAVSTFAIVASANWLRGRIARMGLISRAQNEKLAYQLEADVKDFRAAIENRHKCLPPGTVDGDYQMVNTEGGRWQ